MRTALRQLTKTPGFAIIVMLVIGLGIGVNVATFGAIDALFFRPPSGVTDPGTARRLEVTMPPVPGQQVFFNLNYSFADVAALAARHEAFASLAPYATGVASLTDVGTLGRSPAMSAEGEPSKVHVTLAGGRYFQTLGVRPALGRAFTAAEDSTFDAAPVVMLSSRFWHRMFGGDRSVLGTTIRLDGRPFTIVGILPDEFKGIELEPADLFMPVGMASAIGYQSEYIRKPSMKWLSVVARLAPGVDDRRAEAVATTVLHGIDATSADGPVLGFDAKRGRGVKAVPLNSHFGQGAFATSSPVPLWMLGATLAVLLVVCANVANLLVARAERRRREIATRIALGAGRRRIVRQMLAEGLVLAAGGGALGMLIASFGARILLLIPHMPALDNLVDGRAALFALAATLVTTVGFAVAPALHAARGNAGELLRAGTRGTARATPIRAALLAVQFAASLALLGVGALFVRSLRNVQAVDVGFDIAQTVAVTADWDAFGVTSKEAKSLLERAAERARALPTVTGATLVAIEPFTGVSMGSLTVPGRGDLSAISGVPGGMFFTNAVGDPYFRTLGIPIVRGRTFDASDADSMAHSVIVNETFAKRIWPGEDAVGKCVSTDTKGEGPCMRIVGVARDARFTGLTSPIAPIFFTPFSQQTSGPAQLIVSLRAGLSDSMRRQTMRALRSTIVGLDSRVPFAGVHPVGEAMFASALAPYRVSATAFTVFGVLALTLAAIGLYGVVAYAVTQRTGEFGVRIALGARARDVMSLVLRQGIRLVGVGAAIGFAAAIAVARMLRSRLYGVEPVDAPALIAVALVLAIVSLVACWLPARRASRVDPAVTLKYE